MGWCCLRHIYLYVRDINRLAPIRAVDRFMSPFVWLLVPPGWHVSARVCLPVLLTVCNVTLWCVLWGNPAWGFGINITFHVNLEMLGCTSCRACCLLCCVFVLFFSFAFHDRHVVRHFHRRWQQVLGRRARCCISITVGTTAVNRPKHSRNKSAVATLQETKWTFIGYPQSNTVGEILD